MIGAEPTVYGGQLIGNREDLTARASKIWWARGDENTFRGGVRG